MPRRFECTRCGMKWFIPESRPAMADLVVCNGCGAALRRLADDGARAPSAWGHRPVTDRGRWTLIPGVRSGRPAR